MIGHRVERYPLPVAYSARLLETAQGPADRLEQANHFIELVATTLGVLALGWCHANSISPDGVAQWEKKLEPSGIALGTWIALIRSASKEMRGSPHDPFARAVSLSAVAALPKLENFNPIRNVYAHGGKPRLRQDQEAAAEELEGGVSAILDVIEPLTTVQLAHVRACRARGSMYQMELDLLTGYGEPFPSVQVRSPRPFDRDSVIAYHDGNLETAIDLAPFCQWRTCPDCRRREELFYLHQRKKRRSFYLSFTTGHRCVFHGERPQPAKRPVTALGMEPRGSTRYTERSGWRASWAGLASRPRRVTARLVDVVGVVVLAGLGWLAAVLAGMTFLAAVAAVAVPIGLLYEPLSGLTGGTPGKRLLRIEVISVWDARALSRADMLRRAVIADMQLIFPPLAVYNLAWLVWDPARQCLHDRRARSIVITGRSRPGRKI